ncbi:amidohydrolase family protein [Gordonia hankookensis]|uniref:6-methylsalicylate decarboxylase n=1 Tax=Gordonia hankookensis TaxID=589403 RepID=A0ABR7WCY9_9ACTN|nr:amidohydrolase family protein [Gordonia hankookensis]
MHCATSRNTQTGQGFPVSGELVDVHAHVLPDWYVDAAKAAGHTTPDAMPGWPTWSVQEHLAMMDQVGIDRSVLSISSPGVHFGDDTAAGSLAVEVNDFMRGLHREHPGRFEYFAALPLPDVGRAINEARRTRDLPGRSGVGIESNAHGVYLGDPALEPLWHELAAQRAVVFVHPTAPPGFDPTLTGYPAPLLEYLFDTTRTIVHLAAAGVLRRHPEIRFIVPHCGAVLPMVLSRVDLFRLAGLVPSDVDGDLGWEQLWFDLAGAPVPDQLGAFSRRFGTGHLLYGSDFCFTPAFAVDLLAKQLDDGWPDERGPWRVQVAENSAALFGRNT